MPPGTWGLLLTVWHNNCNCLGKQALVLYEKVYWVIRKVFTSATFNYEKQIVPSAMEDVGRAPSPQKLPHFPCLSVEQDGVLCDWLRHQSQPVTKYHTAWAVKCCRYRHNCMFCFLLNELRWCVPVQVRNINEKTREEPPTLIAKIMMSLSARCNERLTQTQTRTYTHWRPFSPN